jgi:AcrR family transcriptional regulator
MVMRQQEQKLRRQEILETASRMMATRRSGDITIEELASQVSASKRTIYGYFKSKGYLLYQLQTYLYDLITENVYPILDDKSMGPRQRLAEAVHAQVAISCNHWEVARALSTDAALREAPPASARAMARRRRVYEGKFAEVVAEICQAEKLSIVDAKAAAICILGFVASIQRWYRVGEGLSGDQIADYAAHAVLEGFI